MSAESKAFAYLAAEPCPNCGLLPGEDGHGAGVASTMTDRGVQVYLICRSCSEAWDQGEPANVERIKQALAERERAVRFPEAIGG